MMTGRGSTDVQRHNGSHQAEDKAKDEKCFPDHGGRFPYPAGETPSGV